ncbi:MAG: hypothetical protein QOH49_2132 [Acidobacteriota bacterium]|jgi:hypothetical protein|nr:hypothetical protein [Acidobacteriota bacterium]
MKVSGKMKLPVSKRKELEKQGKHVSKPEPGGGALGRLRQFEQERGIDETDLANPSASETKKDEAEDKKGVGEKR